MFKFLLSQVRKVGFQWSKDGIAMEEYKCSPPIKVK